MTSTEKADVSFANLSLEPIGDEALPIAPIQPAKFHANSRSKTRTDRRVTTERRVEIRFQDDRRSGTERRPKKSWEPGNNL